jgi:hypothetical protein
MEEWFHDSNNKNEVINARPQIAKVLQSLQHFPPRNTNTNGYNLPKMHGIIKMQEYILGYLGVEYTLWWSWRISTQVF